MYIIREGLPQNWRWLGAVYAFFGVVAAFGVGNATQINAVVSSVNQTIAVLGGRESLWGNLGMGVALAILVCGILYHFGYRGLHPLNALKNKIKYKRDT